MTAQGIFWTVASEPVLVDGWEILPK